MGKTIDELFEKLTRDRTENANVYEKPSSDGVNEMVVNKYSDQAHFVYELIQNADDAGATKIRFILERERLFFIHNGTRHFFITDVDNERSDKENGTIGDINAITSIGASSKKNNVNKIGKFGIGFKAVFQYTKTPIVYDKFISFKIERMVVPYMIKEDCRYRTEDETCFEFPFNSPDIDPETAYREICNKLQLLNLPMTFLKNIKEIYYKIENIEGYYIDDTEKVYNFGIIHIEKTLHRYIEKYDGAIKSDLTKKFFKISKRLEDENTISLLFFLDNNDKIKIEKFKAFCFFSTKVTTGLSFAIHAPFLLNDSREGILAGKKHNVNMVDSLAELAADALECLRDIGIKEKNDYIGDNFFDIIPYDKDEFVSDDSSDQISFLPFYEKIKIKLKTRKLLPAGDNIFVRREHAYWSEKVRFTKVFANKQLRELVDDDEAYWVFRDVSRRGNDFAIQSYIQEITAKSFLPNDLLRMVNVKFTSNQTQVWLIELYKYLMTSNSFMEAAKTIPIILDQNKIPTPAYNEDGSPAVFLAVGDTDTDRYKFVYQPMTKNRDVKDFLRLLNVHEPSLKDEINNHILPLYEDGGEPDPRKHWSMFLRYYCEGSSKDINTFIEKLKHCKFFFYIDNDAVNNAYYTDIYKYDDDIKRWFDGIKNINFYDYAMLRRIALRIHAQDELDSFLERFNQDNALPKFIKYEYSPTEAFDKKLPYSTMMRVSFKHWEEIRIDGFRENLDIILRDNDIQRAFFVWKIILKLYNTNTLYNAAYNFNKKLQGTARYLSRNNSWKGCSFPSSELEVLRNSKWLVSENDKLVAPIHVTIQELNKYYNIEDRYTLELLKFLGVEEESTENLSDRQKEKLHLMSELLSVFSDAELKKMLADGKKHQEKKQKESPRNGDGDVVSNNGNSIDDEGQTEDNGNVNKNSQKVECDHAQQSECANVEDVDEDFTALAKEISVKASRKQREKREWEENKTKNHSTDYKDEQPAALYDQDLSVNDDDIEIPDEDDYIKAPVDYQKKIDREMEKAAEQVEQIKRMQELSQEADKASKYSFGWFKALLDMETGVNDTGSSSREVNIKFGHVIKEPKTEKTLILSNPNQYIPMFMEEVSNVKLEFSLSDGSQRNAWIDAMSVKGYKLKVKLRSADEISGFDLADVRECRIAAQSPAFLLNELIKSFSELGLADGCDMKAELTENIKFIFGPPGTGKTTYLAREVITPFMKEDNKVLVLTPTNKAADVLAKRLFDLSEDKEACKDWLIRFGSTNDESLEKDGIFKDKTIRIQDWKKYTVVTTIARFPYDFFIDGGRLLKEMEWDYIVFDEASMIHLPNIIYPLYKLKPKGFVIAGDPLQIAPIAKVDLWKDENIYSMTGLQDFGSPHTEPYEYEVIQLKKQYRSIPVVGEIYSRFAYNGLLEHNRQENDVRRLNIEDELPLKNLNIVRFPVSPYEGVYRAKRLQSKSPYHVYAALFAVEFTKYIADLLYKKNGDEPFSIGVIAPYKTEANLIDKLLVQQEIPKSVTVQAGTIHGFQGDECDIILCVFNPPPKISASPEMFLNKRNIINVAISRARDYLVVLMPDDNTPGMESLKYVKYLTDLMRHYQCTEISASRLEEIMFDSPTHIEDITFTTSHQDVNVYGLPEKHYEVRSEDTALDVQIHKKESEHESIEERETEVNTDDVINREQAADTTVMEPDSDRESEVFPEEKSADDGWEASADMQAEDDVQSNEVEQEARLYAPHMDIYDVTDSDGWNIQELALAMDIFDRFKTNGESIETLIDELTAQMLRTDRPDAEGDRIKMALIYKMGVFSRLEQGLGMDAAGASELEYEIWQIYKGNPLMYEELKEEAAERLMQ
ncbi:sacsin N-terminal ATP-binding-like domain-containing protein [Selenomonas ruminantium]|uniref:sacsin N-terminal ATP-binding-like domain-containing protein n=1 Tax=Selenomonas ruminantium TaxID=971 RepID=UPI0026F10D34|nr:AAA domain-containing protein [Selenomonas ruminantium]